MIPPQIHSYGDRILIIKKNTLSKPEMIKANNCRKECSYSMLREAYILPLYLVLKGEKRLRSKKVTSDLLAFSRHGAGTET
jgi:hypothetical protein